MRSLFINSLFFYTIFLFLTVDTFSQSNNYLWPTDASQLMTSSFCEFRPRHYHAAIDIKTWGQTGYKVYAITDGYVIRVRIGAFGYGNAVYLKLNDGNIAVYAHLDRFWPALEKYVDKIRKSNQQYQIDLHLKSSQFPVKKGQIVGYTGQTGIGVPHLHFEMRNKKNEPINPLIFYSQIIKDNIPPNILQLGLIPLNHKSLINLKTDSLFYKFKQNHQNNFPDTLFLTGKIGLSLMVYDYANGANNRFSFDKAQMLIDDKIVYDVKYESFTYAETALIELDKNFSLWRKGKGIFHNFFKHPANTLNYYQGISAEGGVINSDDLNDGLHHLQIKIEDFWGNNTEFQMYFVSGNPLNLQTPVLQSFGENYFIRFKSSEEIKNINLSSNNSTTWIPLKQQQLYSELLLENQYYYTFLVQIDSSNSSDFLKLQGQTVSDFPTFPTFLKLKTNYSDSNSTTFNLQNCRIKKNWLELSARVSPNYANRILPKLQNKINDIIYFPLSYDMYQIQFPIRSLDSNIDIYEAMFEEKIPEYKLVNPKESIKITSQDRLFSANFNPGAMYEEIAVSIKTYESTNIGKAMNHPYRTVGSVYEILPFDQPVNRGVQISMTIPESERNAAGLGIYFWDNRKGWTFLSSHFDSLDNRFSTNVTSLELFSIGQDTVPPILFTAQESQKGELVGKNGILYFTIKDEKSGIRRESQINIYIDNEWQLFEYDPEEDLVTVKIPKNTNISRSIKISVLDNVGNQLNRTYRLK